MNNIEVLKTKIVVLSTFLIHTMNTLFTLNRHQKDKFLL